jgi:hypothetical protein
LGQITMQESAGARRNEEIVSRLREVWNEKLHEVINIVEKWGNHDGPGLLRQLGLLPSQ